MKRRSLETYLDELPMLSGLRQKERELLAMVMREQRCRPGEVICAEGEPGDACFFIISGEVDVVRRVKSGGERVLTTLREDAIFGQIALVDSGPRTATCRALGDVHLARLQRADFETLFSSGSNFAFLFQEAIAKVAVEQLRHANSRLQLLMQQAKSSDAELEGVSDLLSMRDAGESIHWEG